MRRRGPSKQRLWLGSGRYLCSRGRRNANAHANCHSDSDSDADCHPYRNGNGHAATHANTEVGANRKAASDASAAALDFALPKNSGDRVTGVGNSVVVRFLELWHVVSTC
jgi:hypothetical protein